MQGENSMKRNSKGDTILRGYDRRLTWKMVVVMSILQGLAWEYSAEQGQDQICSLDTSLQQLCRNERGQLGAGGPVSQMGNYGA